VIVLDSVPEEYGRILAYGLALGLLVTLVYAASTSGTVFDAYNSRWDGSASLRGIADQTDTEINLIQETETYTTVETDAVAFVLAPTENYTTQEVAQLRTFIRRGGTLVLASDTRSSPAGERLLRALGSAVGFVNATVRDEQYTYRSPAMPVARNVRNHTLTRDTESVTLNYGTALRPGNATVLVNTSEFAYLDRDGSQSITGNETLARRPVIVEEQFGNGTVVTVSDPSVFINSMLERPGNEQFVRNLAGTHQRVLLDYSHTAAVPPLVAALLTVRQSPLLQILLGVVGLALVVVWGRNVDVGSLVANPKKTDDASTAAGITVDAADVAAYLRREYPEWDEERTQRIAESAVRDRGE
jgi:hypothetical protein